MIVSGFCLLLINFSVVINSLIILLSITLPILYGMNANDSENKVAG